MLPLRPVCLLDSFALMDHLRRRSLKAVMVIGVRGDPFSAHCWVQNLRHCGTLQTNPCGRLMKRYFALIAHTATAEARASALMRRAEHQFGLHLAATSEGFWVACNHDADVVESWSPDLIVLGSLRGRSGDTSITHLGEVSTSKVLRSAGQELINEFWGGYVAFIAGRSSKVIHVVRDPSGIIPCLYHELDGLVCIVSDLQLLLGQLGPPCSSHSWMRAASASRRAMRSLSFASTASNRWTAKVRVVPQARFRSSPGSWRISRTYAGSAGYSGSSALAWSHSSPFPGSHGIFFSRRRSHALPVHADRHLCDDHRHLGATAYRT